MSYSAWPHLFLVHPSVSANERSLECSRVFAFVAWSRLCMVFQSRAYSQTHCYELRLGVSASAPPWAAANIDRGGAAPQLRIRCFLCHFRPWPCPRLLRPCAVWGHDCGSLARKETSAGRQVWAAAVVTTVQPQRRLEPSPQAACIMQQQAAAIS